MRAELTINTHFESDVSRIFVNVIHQVFFVLQALENDDRDGQVDYTRLEFENKDKLNAQIQSLGTHLLPALDGENVLGAVQFRAGRIDRLDRVDQVRYDGGIGDLVSACTGRQPLDSCVSLDAGMSSQTWYTEGDMVEVFELEEYLR
jgi:hypothetical protein